MYVMRENINISNNNNNNNNNNKYLFNEIFIFFFLMKNNICILRGQLFVVSLRKLANAINRDFFEL